MDNFRDLMNFVSYIEESAPPPLTPAQEQENEALMEAMRCVEALFDY